MWQLPYPMEKLLKSKITTALAVAVLFWSITTITGERGRMLLVKKEVADLQGKIDNVKKSNDHLETSLKDAKNPAYLEKEARLRLNYKLEGEEVAYVYPETSTDASASVDFHALLPNYKKWFYYLLGK